MNNDYDGAYILGDSGLLNSRVEGANSGSDYLYSLLVNMEITIESQETEYVKIVRRYEIKVKGKLLKVVKWIEQDNLYPASGDDDYEIETEGWMTGLTEEEVEEVEEFIGELQLLA